MKFPTRVYVAAAAAQLFLIDLKASICRQTFMPGHTAKLRIISALCTCVTTASMQGFGVYLRKHELVGHAMQDQRKMIDLLTGGMLLSVSTRKASM